MSHKNDDSEPSISSSFEDYANLEFDIFDGMDKHRYYASIM